MGNRPGPDASRPSEPLVLVVDDDASIREVAQAALELVGGCTVLTAGSGEECRRTAAEERPDVILLDVMMPGTDGPATQRLLSDDERTSDIPIIYLTAKSDSVLQQSPPIVRGMILKPFDPIRLMSDVEALLGWRS
ncbi:response regulator [Desertihabitans brevis]|uniref:response regulator n=1 Tax=Desertihabitans brevis TaxID=2268447 RepID=UPI001F211C7D|nr:response regulator [Desertihabitans brevis]